jgi:hypothetical protein
MSAAVASSSNVPGETLLDALRHVRLIVNSLTPDEWEEWARARPGAARPFRSHRSRGAGTGAAGRRERPRPSDRPSARRRRSADARHAGCAFRRRRPDRRGPLPLPGRRDDAQRRGPAGRALAARPGRIDLNVMQVGLKRSRWRGAPRVAILGGQRSSTGDSSGQ